MPRFRLPNLLRCFGWAGGLLLAGAGCDSTPARAPLAAARDLTTSRPPPPATPVAPLLRALLDTTAAGSARAADARRGLRAGAAVRAFFGPNPEPVWTAAPAGLNADATAALTLLAGAADHGLRPADYGLARLHALRDSLARPGPAADAPAQTARQQAHLELYLSDAVLRFMHDVGRGRLRAHVVPARERAAGPAGQPTVVLRAGLGRHAVPAAMLAGQPANREYRELQRALARWLRQPVAPDSAADHRTRFEQAALNLERWRWNPLALDSTYLLINIPAYELVVVARGTVARRHRVIVGQPATPTPVLSSTIRYFTLAPGWHVPRSIATGEILPAIKRDARYLERHNMALYDRRGRQLNPARVAWARVTAQNFAYTIRQSSGCDNALGNIVFRFANPYSVYLHDTPVRQFFRYPDRALSHGCIRLEHPLALAAYLLGREGNRTRLPTEDECARQPDSRDIHLARPMPLYVRYATCTGENGDLRFFPDVYRRDETLRRALFGSVL